MKRFIIFFFAFIMLVPNARASQLDDPWEGVKFDWAEMMVVLSYVKNFYIDEHYNKKICWVWAANGALGTLKPHAELLPDKYVEYAKKSKKWRRFIKGRLFKLNPSDHFYIHFLDNSFFKKITFDEENERMKEIEKAWKDISFGRDDFMKVMDFVKKEGAKEPLFSLSKAYINATNGYLSALDPHSSIVSVKAWERDTKEREDSSFEGIGAILMQKGHDIIVETPMEGMPAQKAGLKPGDVIIAVDGKDVRGLDLNTVVKMIRGPKGTAVVLTIKRRAVPHPLKIKIIRSSVEVKNVTYKLIKYHPAIGYVKIRSFVPNTTANVKRAIEQLQKIAPGGRLRGLVVDLRGNPGGLLVEAISLADEFLDKGVIVTVKGRAEGNEVYRASEGSFKMPMVVLVDADSASASEIFAGAMQDNGRALIIGDRSFGKASVQSLFTPFTGKPYYIKLTIARYYAPSGRTIQVVGIHPDVYVPPTPGGKMPKAFREEDLLHHLSKIAAKKYTSKNAQLLKQIKPCVDRVSIADAIDHSNPTRNVKFDYQLYRSVDYLEGELLFDRAGNNSFCMQSRSFLK